MISKKALLALYLKKQSIRQQVNMLNFYEDQKTQKLVALESKSDNVILTKNNFLESESDNETSEEY